MGWMGDIADTLGSSLGSVLSSDPGQKGNGNYSTNLISSIITAGTGLAGAFMDQKAKRQALEQANKQAEDAYALEQQRLALAGKGGGGSGAAEELARRQLMLQAYEAYSNSYANAAQGARQGWGKVADSMQTPLLIRAK